MIVGSQPVEGEEANPAWLAWVVRKGAYAGRVFFRGEQDSVPRRAISAGLGGIEFGYVAKEQVIDMVGGALLVRAGGRGRRGRRRFGEQVFEHAYQR